MRTITAGALAEITKDNGAEPVNIVEIQWVEGDSRTSYADRDIGTTVQGKIMELSALDSVVGVSGGSDSQSISLTIDDSDETIKNIFDAHDIHKRPVWVYQWFEGLPLTDKFLLFRGQVNSPIEWDEGARTFRFDVVTKVEDKEVGFSAEEGQFPQIPDSLIGRPWPMAFGTVLDMPAIRLAKSISGTTQQGVGIVSGKDEHRQVRNGNDSNRIGLGMQLAKMAPQASVLAKAAHDWSVRGGGLPGAAQQAASLFSQANAISAQMTRAAASFEASEKQTRDQRQEQVEDLEHGGVAEGPSTIKILGGEDFPQGVPVTVDIGGGLFTGIFDCQDFRILSRSHPENEARAAQALAQTQEGGVQEVNGGSYDVSAQGATQVYRQRGFIIGAQTIGPVANVNQVMQHHWADAGSQVNLVSDLQQRYIVSIVPGTVRAVKAYKQFEGVRKLVNVPNALWSQITENFGPITAETVELTKQLSSIPDQGWEDEIYVTFESSVGPNTVDVIEYFIDTYSDLSKDATSFAAVKTKLAPFPSNFALFDRPQILDLLRDIAFQCRCALFIKDDTVYLKYLPEDPTADETVTEDDIASQSVSVTLTPTEDLITKMIVTWRPTYADEDERKMILRHNVSKYGDQAQEFDWFIYTQPDIIRKAATFWLIRKSNTWKRVRFKTFLNKLRLETFDTVNFNPNRDFVATGAVKTVVEQAVYDSEDNTIQFECLVPVKAGTMTQYKFFWPAAAEGTFPLPEDFPGGDNIGANATGELPVSSLNLPSPCSSKIFIGGPNIVFEGPADFGDPNPQDTGFTAQNLIAVGTDFNIIAQAPPTPDLTLRYTPDIDYPDLLVDKPSQVIDIHKTAVVDTTTGAAIRASTLSTILDRVNSDGNLVIDVNALFRDVDDNEAIFDFRYDTEGEKFGAGTAFLQPLDE